MHEAGRPAGDPNAWPHVRGAGHPPDRPAGLLTELSQQFALDYLVHTDLNAILEDGVEAIRSRIEEGLRSDAGLQEMGLAVVSIRVGAIKPEAEVERALQVRVRRADVARDDLDRFLFEPDDIVFAVGQDGLVANIAKYLSGQFVVGVNPLPERFDGVLVRIAPADRARPGPRSHGKAH